jgi:hypothetical protein
MERFFGGPVTMRVDGAKCSCDHKFITKVDGAFLASAVNSFRQQLQHFLRERETFSRASNPSREVLRTIAVTTAAHCGLEGKWVL